jgi:hypothetical protein
LVVLHLPASSAGGAPGGHRHFSGLADQARSTGAKGSSAAVCVFEVFGTSIEGQ